MDDANHDNQISADQIVYDSLCCFNKYSICVWWCMDKLHILLLTFLINLS